MTPDDDGDDASSTPRTALGGKSCISRARCGAGRWLLIHPWNRPVWVTWSWDEKCSSHPSPSLDSHEKAGPTSFLVPLPTPSRPFLTELHGGKADTRPDSTRPEMPCAYTMRGTVNGCSTLSDQTHNQIEPPQINQANEAF